MKNVIGRVKRHPDGFGFLLPDDPEQVDVYLPRHTMTDIMTDDRVEVRCQKERDGRFSGEILKIIKRAVTRIVGKYRNNPFNKFGTIVDEGSAWGQSLTIAPDDTLNAKENDLVLVEIITYPDSKEGFTGRVVEIMGVHGDPLHDTKRVLYEHHIPIEFSEAALKIAEALPDVVEEKDIKGRKDLRDKKFITIDGATARDFDDAVYAEKEATGFCVWVAIADVAHYVKEGTRLDQEAYERGTSVYFPNMVVPMLPEKISNGLCSLNPHLPRLVMVAEVHLDFSGHVTKTDFYEGVFQSQHRMIYGEVEDLINGLKNPKYDDVLKEVNLMADIAKILMKKRFNEGSLDLEIPESILIIDPSGVPTDVVRGERLFAHRLIEELMLLANVAVAKFIHKSGTPSLYRVHETPFADSLKNFQVMAHNWGLKVKFTEMIQKGLMHMLDHVRDKPEEHILSILILRSMKQAQYSVENVGHFGLAFDCYTHFTSPIRRYPDLIVHRTLKRLLNGDKSGMGSDALYDKMATSGTFLSGCEQRAVKAERENLAIKRCRFMQRHIGDTLEGLVTSVVKFGFFVQLRAYDIDGLVKLETLRGDRIMFDDVRQVLTGKNTGTLVSLGDTVMVKVLRADPEAQEIDFEWVNDKLKNATDNDRPSDRPNIQERGETSPNRGGFRQARFSQHSGAGKAGPVHSKKANKKRRSGKAKRR